MSISSMRGRWGARLRTRFSLLSLSLGIAFGVVPLAVTPLVVDAGGGSGIGFTLLGCKGSESLLPPGGPYLCPDADYVDGNLGKNWNELDLVPMRLVATANGSAPASQTYGVATVADKLGVDGGNRSFPGFDYMSLPVLNAALSDPTCTAATADPATGPGATYVADTAGDEQLYRNLSITQAKGTTCVYDYYQRVALGASTFPGSSLHSFLGSLSVSGATTDLDKIPGVKTIPLDVNPSSAPSLSAAISATQGAGYVWTVGKTASPNPLSMSNTCNPDARSVGVDITLSWTRQQQNDTQATVVESVYADNPAGRAFDVSASATLFDAASTQLAPADVITSLSVPANSSHYLLGSFTHSVALSSSYSTSVSGSFTDPVTSQGVGSNPLTASASAPLSTVVSNSNATAVVTDAASISGAGLRYSIDSVSLPGGSFGSYVLGTPTSGGVTWTSPTLTGNGGAVLHETVSTTGAVAGTGSLDDTATVTDSGHIATGINLQVPVSTAALFALTIDKTIPDVLQGAETAAFDFTVVDAHGTSTPATIDFAAGQTSGSTTLGGLAAGTYLVHEEPQAGWVVQPDQTVVAAVPTCSYTTTFANTVIPAVATVQKSTLPAGHQAGWQFTLTGPGAPAGGETATTDASGAITFSTPLQEGDYTIVESSVRSGWVQGAATGCSFTVDYPADGGRTFTCAVTNIQGVVNTPVTGGSEHSGVQGVTTVSTPDTGADIPYAEAAVLLLLGGGLAGYGWRRSRRSHSRRLVLR